ncbi:MAG: helix-turn-helix domain-containing protein, partial [Candidatus Puniceispirillaceae bacterium]
MTSKNFTSSQGIQVIARAAAILRVLKDDNSGLSLGQIADRTRLARSTVQRIVNALVDEGLVMTGERGGSLRLGPEIQAMASASRSDITDLLHPLLAHLSSITGETVDLAL